MKKELCAVILLAALLLGAGANILHMDALASEVLSLLDESQRFSLCGDTDGARRALDEALELWLSSDGYTHIFIRHPEIDSASDAFYELRQALDEGSEGLDACYDKLRYHMMSIADMEQFRLGSIL